MRTDLVLPDHPTPLQVSELLSRVQMAVQYLEEPREAAGLVRISDAIKYLAGNARVSMEIQNAAAEMALRARRRAGGFQRSGSA